MSFIELAKNAGQAVVEAVSENPVVVGAVVVGSGVVGYTGYRLNQRRLAKKEKAGVEVPLVANDKYVDMTLAEAKKANCEAEWLAYVIGVAGSVDAS